MGYVGFEHEKEQFLRKTDKSKKGSIDKKIKGLVNLINKHPDYYTTSSCSGRTMLIRIPRKGKKWESEWLFSSHGKVGFRQVKEAINSVIEMGIKDPIWLKKEGLILHICCRNLESAFFLVDIASKSGFKRPAVISAKRKIVVEILDTEKIELPVIISNKVLVDDKYLKVLINEANIKQDATLRKIKRLYTMMAKYRIDKVKKQKGMTPSKQAN
ncbi:MAG: tRNA wybutosine-synthesizing 3 family protein [Candidatus Woesearchaeota archaeon]|nr:tRNA wybutosine-synthesizing 3 family protein [Candidatus Woesearchaeota archaeon]